MTSIPQPERDSDLKKAKDSSKHQSGKNKSKRWKTKSDSSNSKSMKASRASNSDSDSDLGDRRHKEPKLKRLSIRDLEELICQRNDLCEDHDEHCHIMVTKGMEGHHIILDHKNIRRWAGAVVSITTSVCLSPDVMTRIKVLLLLNDHQHTWYPRKRSHMEFPLPLEKLVKWPPNPWHHIQLEQMSHQA